MSVAHHMYAGALRGRRVWDPLGKKRVTGGCELPNVGTGYSSPALSKSEYTANHQANSPASAFYWEEAYHVHTISLKCDMCLVFQQAARFRGS